MIFDFDKKKHFQLDLNFQPTRFEAYIIVESVLTLEREKKLRIVKNEESVVDLFECIINV